MFGANQMDGFFMKCNNGLKWVSLFIEKYLKMKALFLYEFEFFEYLFTVRNKKPISGRILKLPTYFTENHFL